MTSDTNPPAAHKSTKRVAVLKYPRLSLRTIELQLKCSADNHSWRLIAAELLRQPNTYVDITKFCDDAPTDVCRWLVGHPHIKIEPMPGCPQFIRWTGEPLHLPATGWLAKVEESFRRLDDLRWTVLSKLNVGNAEEAAKDLRDRAAKVVNSIDTAINASMADRLEAFACAVSPHNNQVAHAEMVLQRLLTIRETVLKALWSAANAIAAIDETSKLAQAAWDSIFTGMGRITDSRPDAIADAMFPRNDALLNAQSKATLPGGSASEQVAPNHDTTDRCADVRARLAHLQAGVRT
jgi:hypothetical protein